MQICPLEKISFLIQEKLLSFSKNYSGISVACSGGIDSTVLAHLIFKNLDLIKKKNPDLEFELKLVHVNFNLRGSESNEDALFVQELANSFHASFGVWIEQEKKTPYLKSESTQMWARRIRYDYFHGLQNEKQVIALAHHKEDLAESVLLRLTRGSSLEAIIGMKPFYKGFWRPLLEFTKADLKNYCARHNLHHREDSSNDMMKYARNKIRHSVLPIFKDINEGSVDHVIDFAKEVQDMSSYVNLQATQLFSQHLVAQNQLSFECFKKGHLFLHRKILVSFFQENKLPTRSLHKKTIDPILEKIALLMKKTQIKGKSTFTFDLPYFFQLTVTNKSLTILKNP